MAGGCAGYEDLLREARAASALAHPNICTIHEVLESHGESYIVMELVEGRSLSDAIGRRGLAADSVLHYGRQIADAVAHAHSRGIIHRDLKTGNIIVSPDGRVTVLDFGLASRLSSDKLEAVTRSGDRMAVAGTIAYMAPELLRGETADQRSDIWAMGVILYQMAVARLPFDGRTAYELSAAILNAPLRWRLSRGVRSRDPGPGTCGRSRYCRSAISRNCLR